MPVFSFTISTRRFTTSKWSLFKATRASELVKISSISMYFFSFSLLRYVSEISALAPTNLSSPNISTGSLLMIATFRAPLKSYSNSAFSDEFLPIWDIAVLNFAKRSGFMSARFFPNISLLETLYA